MKKAVKFVNSLSKELRQKVANVIALILAREFETLDLKKIQGEIFLYRVRVGKIRILFIMDQEMIEIIDVGWRTDNTYK